MIRKDDNMKHEINLDTMSKINKFVAICSRLNCRIDLIDGNGYRISAKSLVGVLATVDWSQVFVVCEEDIYSHIKDFIVEE